MEYNPKIVIAFFKSEGIPEPLLEEKFHSTRKWRFDFSWDFWWKGAQRKLALEINGGLFVGGRHTQGAALLKEYEKNNEACALGWRVLYVQPKDLCTVDTANLIKRCLGI